MLRHYRIPKTTLNNLKALAPAQDQVAQGYTNIVVDNFAVTLWSIVVPEHLHRTNDLYSRSICGNNHYALLAVLVRVVWVALSEDKVQGAARITSAANPPAKE